MSLKAAIYDPYLDTLGGGERYCLTVCEILLKHGYHVDIFWSGNQEIVESAKQRFALNLEGLTLKPDIFGLTHQKIELIEENTPDTLHSISIPKANIFQKITNYINKYKVLSKYDLVFFLSDGSIPFLFSKNNILHIQVPFIQKITPKDKILNLIKQKFINSVVCNSNFTSKFIVDFPKSKLKVLYPPVDVEKFSSSEEKENIILSVGRFDNILNAKKQDVLIEAFKKLHKINSHLKWKLVLMGGSRDHPDKNHYLLHLQHISKNYPIEFIVNPNFDQLKEIYSKSKIYWHAAGYGVDEYLHPEQTEHFGMTVVEAMDSGLVPIVVAKGGLSEIVTEDKNGFLWNTTDELIAKTQILFATPKDLKDKAHQAHLTSQNFSKEIFEKKLLDLIKQ
ncbi:MAG TPA: glycosyltransferase family 4 protein [Candidatus Methanoperedens sp.]|nr:glycosyltransferase family 4 protein [Candidatus Methanoperedens sp.]